MKKLIGLLFETKLSYKTNLLDGYEENIDEQVQAMSTIIQNAANQSIPVTDRNMVDNCLSTDKNRKATNW